MLIKGLLYNIFWKWCYLVYFWQNVELVIGLNDYTVDLIEYSSNNIFFWDYFIGITYICIDIVSYILTKFCDISHPNDNVHLTARAYHAGQARSRRLNIGVELPSFFFPNTISLLRWNQQWCCRTMLVSYIFSKIFGKRHVILPLSKHRVYSPNPSGTYVRLQSTSIDGWTSVTTDNFLRY